MLKEEPKKLIAWEDMKKNQVRIAGRYRPSGVACPMCKEELLIDTMIVLTSYPEKYGYHCPKCEWHGTA